MSKLMPTAIAVIGLIAALWAVPAYADDLVAGDGQTAPEAASTVDMYLLSQIGDMKCTYNKKGLIAKRENSSTAVSFKYAGTDMKSYTSTFRHGRSQSKTTGKLSYANGRLMKLVVKGADGKVSTDEYSYGKAGRVTKYTHVAAGQKLVRYACRYDAEGRLAKQNASGGDSTKTTFGYDAKGNLSTASYRFGLGGSERVFANKYNKAGRLAKKVTTITSAGSYSTTMKYSYAKVAVPVRYAQQVAKQQWSLLNPQVSFSYPLNY